jgi:hypothetical protein
MLEDLVGVGLRAIWEASPEEAEFLARAARRGEPSKGVWEGPG